MSIVAPIGAVKVIVLLRFLGIIKSGRRLRGYEWAPIRTAGAVRRLTRKTSRRMTEPS